MTSFRTNDIENEKNGRKNKKDINSIFMNDFNKIIKRTTYEIVKEGELNRFPTFEKNTDYFLNYLNKFEDDNFHLITLQFEISDGEEYQTRNTILETILKDEWIQNASHLKNLTMEYHETLVDLFLRYCDFINYKKECEKAFNVLIKSLKNFLHNKEKSNDLNTEKNSKDTNYLFDDFFKVVIEAEDILNFLKLKDVKFTLEPIIEQFKKMHNLIEGLHQYDKLSNFLDEIILKLDGLLKFIEVQTIKCNISVCFYQKIKLINYLKNTIFKDNAISIENSYTTSVGIASEEEKEYNKLELARNGEFQSKYNKYKFKYLEFKDNPMTEEQQTNMETSVLSNNEQKIYSGNDHENYKILHVKSNEIESQAINSQKIHSENLNSNNSQDKNKLSTSEEIWLNKSTYASVNIEIYENFHKWLDNTKNNIESNVLILQEDCVHMFVSELGLYLNNSYMNMHNNIIQGFIDINLKFDSFKYFPTYFHFQSIMFLIVKLMETTLAREHEIFSFLLKNLELWNDSNPYKKRIIGVLNFYIKIIHRTLEHNKLELNTLYKPIVNYNAGSQSIFLNAENAEVFLNILKFSMKGIKIKLNSNYKLMKSIIKDQRDELIRVFNAYQENKNYLNCKIINYSIENCEKIIKKIEIRTYKQD